MNITKEIEILKKSNVKLYVACTGAGAGIADVIWQYPGISNFFMGYTFPYNQKDFDLFIGKKLNSSYSSREAAITLAQSSFYRCEEICAKNGDFTSNIFGIGLAASVSTNRTLKGGTKIFVAIRTKEEIKAVEVWTEQGQLGRKAEGHLCNKLLLNILFEKLNIKQIPINKSFLTSENFIEKNNGVILKPQIITLPPTNNNPNIIFTNYSKEISNMDFSNTLIFPGSFNPIHYGHRQIVEAAEKTGKEVFFEISKNIEDKGETKNLSKRIIQFLGYRPVIISNVSLFKQKIKVYKNASFILGYDTAERLLDIKYYNNSAESLIQALEYFKSEGTVFYVASRSEKTIEDLDIPCGFQQLFSPIYVNIEISSSKIRKMRDD